jgi:hypothetical protein
VEVEGIEPSCAMLSRYCLAFDVYHLRGEDTVFCPVCVTISPPCKAKSCGMSLPALHVCSPNSPRSLSLQYRSYLCPIIRWHYGSIDYLDPLCTTALYFTFAGLALHKYTLCRHIVSRLVTPPGRSR